MKKAPVFARPGATPAARHTDALTIRRYDGTEHPSSLPNAATLPDTSADGRNEDSPGFGDESEPGLPFAIATVTR